MKLSIFLSTLVAATAIFAQENPNANNLNDRIHARPYIPLCLPLPISPGPMTPLPATPLPVVPLPEVPGGPTIIAPYPPPPVFPPYPPPPVFPPYPPPVVLSSEEEGK